MIHRDDAANGRIWHPWLRVSRVIIGAAQRGVGHRDVADRKGDAARRDEGTEQAAACRLV